jgi:hypothetical protein
MTAREKFTIGQRVKATRLIPKFERGSPKAGKVVGFFTDPHLVRVLCDGCHYPDNWCIDFWESTEEKPK